MTFEINEVSETSVVAIVPSALLLTSTECVSISEAFSKQFDSITSTMLLSDNVGSVMSVHVICYEILQVLSHKENLILNSKILVVNEENFVARELHLSYLLAQYYIFFY